MGAFRTLLTHFSQRYPSAPPYPVAVEGRDESGVVPPILAFDFMHVSFRDLLWAPATCPALSIAFPAETEDDENENGEENEGEGEQKQEEGAEKVMAMKVTGETRKAAAVPGAFARPQGRRQCTCCVGIDDDMEDMDSITTSARATDKMRRKRKGCLREMAAGGGKIRGTKL